MLRAVQNRRWIFWALLGMAVTALGACAQIGPVSDGTSVSYGRTNRGLLVGAAELPTRGDGYLIPPTWATRGLNFGTDELVGLLVRAARRTRLDSPGATVYFADLSPRTGGASAWHKSHQAGRDADVLFFALNEDGTPAGPPSAMVSFDEDGVAPDGRRFDTARNWLLVRALLEDPVVEVQFLFVSTWLRQKLLDHAAAIGEPADLVERAEAVLLQPGDAPPHDDHLHVRIYCPASDRSLGCRDRGPLRWTKKGFKYAQLRAAVTATLAMELPRVRPFCQLLARSLVAVR
jgi:penicillin-insensitive murein endopeptidase